MAGIKNIRDLYKKVGEKGLREVLEKKIKVTEKFDAYRFAFEKNPHNYKIYFYGKNGKAPLNKIDRTVNDLYEQAIAYIENLPADIKKAIPVRHRFGFSWFPSNTPLKTAYERRPKKGLVLTDITVRNRDRDVTRDITEQLVFERWAGVFGTEANKPVFEGNLSNETIESLIEMVKNDHTLTSLNESQINTKGLLNEVQQSIEALVFESENTLFKVSDVIANEERTTMKRGHLFDILLLDICEHLNNINLASIKPVSVHSDEAYIEVVSEVFNNFVEKKGKDFMASTLERPKFLEKSGTFNKSWIKNPVTRSIIESHSKYEYLFTVFLTNLRKPKYPSGLLSEAVVNEFNSKIEDVNKLIADGYSFLEFSTIQRESEDSIQVQPPNPPETIEPDFAKGVMLLQSFFSSQRKKDALEPIECVLCNCAFPTNQLVKESEAIHQHTGTRIMLIHDTSYDDYNVDTETIEKMLSRLCEDRNDIFIGYRILNNSTINHIIKKCGKFYPSAIHCLPNKADMLSLDYSGYAAAQCGNHQEFKISKLTNTIYNDCMSSLEKEDQMAFKKNMPDCIHAYWSVLKNSFDHKTYH